MGVFALLLAAALGMPPPASACDFRPQALIDGPHARWTGTFRHERYRYTVVIPKGYVGYSSAQGFSHHGFGVVIGSPPVSYVYVDGSANSLAHASATAAATQLLEYAKVDALPPGARRDEAGARLNGQRPSLRVRRSPGHHFDSCVRLQCVGGVWAITPTYLGIVASRGRGCDRSPRSCTTAASVSP